MNKFHISFSRIAVLTGLLLFFSGGCGVPYEKIVNFNTDTPIEYIKAQYIPDPRKILIQSDDILAVTVSTFDSATARLFNNPVRPSGEDGSMLGQGYLVDKDGNIEFPVLGKIQLKGLTREEAKTHIQNQLLKYLRDPIVEVRFLNMHVSVIGEVSRPGIYTFSDEYFTVLEAIAMAGDLTLMADRQNIMIIREFDKVREFGKVDLSSERAFESSYFYLAQNDIVYVKPLEQKRMAVQDPLSRIMMISSFVISITTVIFSISSLLNR
jgi:polysaccharide export outer membrane protein